MLIECTSVQRVEVAVFVLDLELLFSSRPFETVAGHTGATPQGGSGSGGGNMSFVRPTHTCQLDVQQLLLGGAAAGGGGGGGERAGLKATALTLTDVPSSALPTRLSLQLPMLFGSAFEAAASGGGCALVEVRGGGLTRSVVRYSADLAVRVSERLGQLQVSRAGTASTRSTLIPQPSTPTLIP